MSERKVLNKYYPPDFDPRKLPRLKLSRDRQFVIRIMAPMSIKCDTVVCRKFIKYFRCTNCGEYIYKGKKFNARQETVKNENYLGLRIYRFYIKCPRCMSEITFKTDPKNADYTMEHGGKRCFDAAKLAARALEKELEEKEEEEQANPMLALEKRTNESKMEMESLEKLEELKELNRRHADIDHEQLIDIHTIKKLDEEEVDLKLEEERDEKLTKETFKNKMISTKDIGDKFDFSNVFSSNNVYINNKEKPKMIIPSKGIVVRKRTAEKFVTTSMDIPITDNPEPSKKASALVAYGSSGTDSDN